MEKIGDLYEAYINNNAEFPDLSYFYKNIPKTYGTAVESIKTMDKIEITDNKISKLKQVLIDYHKKLGLLTPKTKENISKIHEGVVLAGQQATVFGGTGIIGNKLAAIANISEISEESGRPLVPVFLINTHDSIQSEITTIHLPNYQSSISKSITISDAIEGLIANTITTSDYDWLEENLAIIKNIFSEFKSTIAKDKSKLFLEKTNHLITFLRETYRNSDNLGEWVTLIWGIQTNILNDWGIVFLPTSNEDVRSLTSDGYLPFLRNRLKYIDEFNKATNKLVKLGFKPTTVKKEPDYSPFFYVCPKDRYRITLTCEEDAEFLTFHGRCPMCKEEYSFMINKNKIDLSPYINNLYPRLDTNQALLQTILPTYLRISGPGEINYNAQVIPSVQCLGINFPLYIKYTRMFYNTPWIEYLCKDESLDQYSILNSDFFQLMGSLAKSRRKGEVKEYQEYTRRIGEYIQSKRLAIKSKSSKPTDIIERLKSWQYGMYDARHQWQEVSWPWFIMAVVTGLDDFLASYKRYYTKDTPVGGIGFINSML